MRYLTRHLRRLTLAVAALLAVPLTLQAGTASAHPGHGDETFNALVFSKTAGFRHDSIPAGIAAIRELAAQDGFTVTATEDASVFTDEQLAKYEVVIWLSTTGDVLNSDQQAAFERYVRGGGGYAGIHAAADTEYDWPWYGKLVGSFFASHPAGTPSGSVKVEDHAHPSTAEAPTRWNRTDEWYNYRTNPRGTVHVLASLDETSYGGGTMGAEHPISWCQDYDGGRSWYTGMGHTIESFSEPAFRKHLLGGIRTAAGVEPADCRASLSDSYQKVTLDDNTSNPMELAIAADGRVFYIDRNGVVKLVKTDGSVVTAGTLPVYTGQEFGLLGMALDPGFLENGFIYLYYSPAGAESYDKVSRFTLTGDTLSLASEQQVLRIDTQREQCCHAGGALEFDGDGNLYVATGDNTNPFASDGYAPIDERSGRAFWDSQRSAANSNNLNGKILRIRPQPDGTYTVPAGNLFPAGTANTRPEIFAMGFRNPFRIGIDPQTEHLLVADYGPDAGSVSDTRGPDGRVEWNIVDTPGFYGWPYCVGNNTPYHDFDFATGASGPLFDCGSVVNDSPNNNGIRNLPPAIPAELWMGKSTTGVPEVGFSGAPMTSGAYQFSSSSTSSTSPRKWPKYFDGKAILADWNDSRMFSVQFDDARTGVADVSRFLEKLSFIRPMALQFGPDGALYLIEWGSGFGGNNTDSGVYRIDYVQGNRAPVARITTDKTSGPVPLTVAFDGSDSRDPDGQPITYAWDFDGNGSTDSTAVAPSHTYTEPGQFTARLTVSDPDGRTAVSNLTITAGNTAPTIEVEWPLNGGYFDFGDTIRYRVTVTDPEDGTVDCSDVITQPGLGHDEHSHGYEQYHGCSGVFPLPGDEGHVGANIFGIVTVTYTDKGAPGTAPLTTQKILQLQPKLREAEFFSETGGPGNGVQIEDTGDVGGGKNIGFIEDGDWWSWRPTNLTDITQLQLRAASPDAGATVQVRTGDPVSGPVVATIQVSATGGWQTYGDFMGAISGATAATGPLYFVKTTGQLNVNWVRFIGKGMTENQRPVVTATAQPTQGIAPLTVSFSATATDPEDDLPLTFAWTFGDGGTGTGASPSHTYTDAGSYTATVRVIDSRGATTAKTIAVQVESPPLPICLTGRSDGFEGTALDTGRWPNVVRPNQDLAVRDGSLVLPLTATDIYGTSNTGTPNIVLQPLPGGAWQATVKLTLTARIAYQQAGLIVYGDDDNYAKMVLQARSTDAPSADARIFQFIREEAGMPNEVGASNTANLGAAYPDTVWVRFTSNGSNLRASYSSDGASFTDMPETKSLAGIAHPQIGLFGLTSRTEALPSTALVDYFTITPDDKAERPPVDDTFDGAALDGCRWTGVVRPDPSDYRVSDGVLEIDTSKGDIYEGAAGNPRNLMLQPATAGDWIIETKVDASAFDEKFQQAGLLVYGSDANYVKLGLVATNVAGQPVSRELQLRSEVDDHIVSPAPNASPPPTQGVWWLRLARNGNTYTGSYSADGQTWQLLPSVPNTALANARFGVYAFGVDQVASKTASFSHFRLILDTVAPTVSLAVDPATPSGEAGWWTAPVKVTASAKDDQPGPLRLEQRVDDGDWVGYSDPVTVSADGSHTVQVRAKDLAGNVSAVGSATVKLDRTPPTVAVTGLPSELGVADVAQLVGSVEDTGSGPGAVTFTVDGVALSGNKVDATLLGLGAHELVASGSDRAGNRAVVKRPFTVVASYQDARKLVDRYRAAGVVSVGTATVLRTYLTLAERQQAKGQRELARRTLDLYVASARTVRDVPARTLLIAVGRDLRSRI